jgi:hypothetical protein
MVSRLWCVSSLLLLDRLVRWVNAQFVLNHLSRDPEHIRYLPCKDIKIVPEKSDECEFLFMVEVVADLELLVWVVGVHCNLLVFCFQDSLQLVLHLLINMHLSRADATLVPFDAGGIRGELSIDGLDADILLGVPPPFVLAACS